MLNNLKYMVILLCLLAAACTEKGIIPDNPQESFANAREPYDDHNYELAIKKLGEFKSRFPYSRYAVEAELLIADSYFATGKFTEAGVAYEQFVKLHPKHEKIDLALFRVGLSYWKDAPEQIDREQEYTQIAISKWEKLIKEFPSNPYTSEAKELMDKGKLRIAKSEDFVARYYCRKEIWHSCAYHSLIILERFKDYTDLATAAIERASIALEHIAKEKPYAKEKNLFNRDATPEELMEKSRSLRERLQH